MLVRSLVALWLALVSTAAWGEIGTIDNVPAATLLFPFVVIRLVAREKQSGELALTLQSPAPLSIAVLAKAFALTIGWLVCGVACTQSLVRRRCRLAIALLRWRD